MLSHLCNYWWSRRQHINLNKECLKNKYNKIAIINIFKIRYLTSREHTFFSTSQAVFLKIHTQLSHNTRLNTSQRIRIVKTIFSGSNTVEKIRDNNTNLMEDCKSHIQKVLRILIRITTKKSITRISEQKC